MATKDIWGRDLGQDVPVNEMARQMSGPTKPTPLPENKESSVSNEKLDKLYEAINRVAELIDSKAAEQLTGTQEYIREILSGHQALQQTTDQGNRSSIEKIDLVAQASRQLLSEFTSQNTAWVGISKLSDRAQSDIRKAFGFIDCCEQIKNVAVEMHGVRSDLRIAEQTKANLLSEQAARSVGGGDDGSLSRQLENTLSNQANSGRRTSGGSGGGGGRGANAPGTGPDMGQMFALAQLVQAGLATATNIATNLADKAGINPLSVFDGLFANQDQYTKNMRVIIHEQHGFGNLNREIEQQYTNIYDQLGAAGVTDAKYKELQSKNLERGLGYLSEQEAIQIRMSKLTDKEQKAGGKEFKVLKRRLQMLHSIQTSASNTATMLHMSADTLNEMFMDMHYHIGLSSMELGEMGRHMQHVAKTTGVTGAQLERAMKSAEGVIKNLKKAGVVSMEANKKVMSFMAASQKYGFEGGADMMNALSSREAFLESSQRMFLSNIAAASGEQDAITDLVMGTTLQNPEGMKRLMKGTENFVKQRFTQVIGPDIADAVGINLNEISPENISKVIEKLQMGDTRAKQAAAVLQRQFKALGMELGEVEQMYKAQKEASKTPLERMGGLDKQLANLQKAKESGVDVSDEIKRVEAEKRALQNNMNMDAIGALNTYQKELETMKKGGDAGARAEEMLLKKMTGILGETDADTFIKELKTGQPKLIGETLKNLDQRLKDSDMGGVASQIAKNFPDYNEFQKKLAAGDAEAVEELQRVMQLEGVKEKAAQDPITSLQETLRETNNYLSNLALAFRLSLGAFGALAIAILSGVGSIVGAIAAFGTTILTAMGGISSMRGLMGGGGGMMGGRGGGRFARGRRAVASGRSGRMTTAARARGTTGRATASSRPRRSRRPRVRGGRGSWLPMLATAGISYMAGSYMSSGGDENEMGDGSVPDLLTQIRDILANCCANGGLGGGKGAPIDLGDLVPEDNGSYLSDNTLDRMDSLANNLGYAQMGMFALADFGGDAAKSASKAATQSIDDVARAATQGVDDVARAATQSVDDVARAAATNSSTVARASASGVDDAVRAANAAANAGTQGSVAAAAGGAGGVPKPPSVPSAAGGAMPKPPAARGFFGKMGDSISSAWNSTKSTVSSAAGSVRSGAGNLLSSAGGALESAKTSVGSAVESVRSGAGTAWQKTSGAVSSAYSSAKGAVGGVGEYLQKKIASGVSVAGDYARLAKDKLGITHVQEFLSKNIKKIIPNALKSGGGTIGKGLMNVLRGAAKYAGPIAGVLELAFTGMDVYEAANQKGVPVEELQSEIGKIVISNGLGFLAGTLAASGLGALLSPIPGGTIVGGILGYMGGDAVGRMLGNAISDYVGGPFLGKTIFDLGSSWGWWPNKGAREADIAAAQEPTGMPDASQVPADAKTVENSLPAYEVGAREILQAGVAQLHEGEVVVPKDVWEKIKAVGAGPFSGAASILSAIKHSFKDSEKPDMNLYESLGMKRKMSMMGLLSPLMLGAFDKKSPMEAGEEQTNLMLKDINPKETLNQESFNFQEKSLNLLEKLVSLTGLSLGINKKETKEKESAGTNTISEVFEKYKSTIGSKLSAASDILGLSKVFSSVTNLGIFDKQKPSEAIKGSIDTELTAEMVKSHPEIVADLFSKFNPDNFRGTNIDPMAGSYSPTISDLLNGSMTNINRSVMATMKEEGLFGPDKKEEASDVEKQNFLSKLPISSLSGLGYGIGKSSPIGETLQKVFESMSEKIKSVVNFSSLGIFDSDKKEEASDVAKQNFLMKMSGLNLNDIAILEMEKYLSKKSKIEKNIVADASDSFNYGTEASDSASKVFGNNYSVLDPSISPSMMDYSDDVKGVASPYTMDYSDDLKGEVGTLGLSRFAMESAVEQKKYGETARTNTAVLPSMDDVADYLLVDQSNKLDQMINLLDAIRNNTSRGSMLGTDVIGSIASDAAPGSSSGIKNAARDMNRGLWDLTYSDYSSSSITTDGRGGIG